MANWVTTFLAENPEYNSLAVAKRARRSIHFRRPDGLVEAYFTGKPMHYAEGNQWKPLDTALRAIGPEYGAPGVPVRLSSDWTARIEESAYAQRTFRVGLFTPSTRKFSGVFSAPIGAVQDDCLVASGAIWEHRLRLVEDGIKETLTLFEMPSVQAASTDYLVIETAILGRSFPDGWLDEFAESGMWFPLPTVTDAAGNIAPARRYARTVGGVQYLYTGIPLSWLATARYPVVLDPDFAGSTADGWVRGINAAYATARSTSSEFYSTTQEIQVGQYRESSTYYVSRGFLRFDTSSIPDGDIVTQVNLKLVCIYDHSLTDFDVQIVKQDWSGQDPLSTANREAAYDNCLAGTADNNIWRNTSGMAPNTQYASGNLSTAWVSKTGNTYYSLRSNRDLNNTTPSTYEYVNLASANHGTPSYRPVLTVIYSSTVTVGRSISLGWDAQAVVPRSLQAAWQVLVSAARETTVLWDTNARVAAPTVLSWDTRTGVAAPTVLVWDTRVGVAAPTVLPWDTRAGVTAPAVFAWDTRTGVATPVVLPWDTRVGIAAPAAFAWDVLAGSPRVTAPVAFAWDTRAGVAVPTTFPWDTRVEVGVPTTLPWDTKVGIAAPTVFPWGTKVGVLVTTAILWGPRVVRLVVIAPPQGLHGIVRLEPRGAQGDVAPLEPRGAQGHVYLRR